VFLFREKFIPMNREETKKVFEKLKQSTDVLNSRLFVILAAQAKGWPFARELEFLESGEQISQVLCLTLSTNLFYFLSGNGQNENFLKVAKLFNKRQQKKDDERELRGLAKKPAFKPRPFAQRQAGGYGPGKPAAFGSSAQAATATYSGASGYQQGGHFAGGSRHGPANKAHLRCHNCAQFGHFAHECNNKPQGPV